MDFKELEKGEPDNIINPYEESEKFILKKLLSADHAGLNCLKDYPFLLLVTTDNSSEIHTISRDLNATDFSIIVPEKNPSRKGQVRHSYNKIDSPEEIYEETRVIGSVLFFNVLGKVKDDISFMNLFLNYDIVSSETKILITYSNTTEGTREERKKFRKFYSRILKNHMQQVGLEIVESGYYFIGASWLNIDVYNKSGAATFFSQIIGKPFLITEFRFFRWLSRIGISVKGKQGYFVCRKIR
jgi:hypothetical protein